jgi:hypothetical protein
MTTTVTVTHNGPDHMDITVQTMQPKDGVFVVTREERVTMGNVSSNIYVYDTQEIHIKEIPKAK